MKTTKKIQITILLVLFTIIAKANTIEIFFQKSDKFFSTFVVDGKVEYEALKYNSELLDETLQIASSININSLDTNSYKAFWINIYNLMVIKGILNNYPKN